jgi:hypothetical protein
MKIWPIAVASLIFGWAMVQGRRHAVRELYRAHDRRQNSAIAVTARSPSRQYRGPANTLQTFRNSSGSLAMSAALRRASSLLSSFAADRRPGSSS